MNIPLQQYWRLLVGYLRPQGLRVVLLAALLLGSIGLQLANPQILRAFIDTAMVGGAPQALTFAALLFIALALAQQILTVLATYVGENVGWTATNQLRADLTLHCLQLDLAFHKARTPGELIERIDGDVTALANFFTQLVIQVLGNLLLLAGVLLALFGEDWRVGLALTGFALVTLVTLHRIRDFAVPRWAQARQSSAELFGFLEEHLAGTEDIRACGAVSYVMRRLYGFLRELLRRHRAARVTGQVTFVTSHALFALGNGVGLALGAYLFLNGAITIGTVYLITYYIGLLTMPLEQITRQLQDLQKAGASIGRIEELTHSQSTIRDGPGAPLPSGALAVEFDHVSFGYDDKPSDDGRPTRDEGRRTKHDRRPPTIDQRSPATDNRPQTSKLQPQPLAGLVLHDISFCLEPGQVLGVIGRTGSGKTTLIRLLLRLYDSSRGTIRLGGADIRAARLTDLRQRVGMVTQDVQLFRASVRDNLTFFDRSIPDARILEALEELGLGPWYRSLPDGLDTRLAAGGGGLSAGQAQLLAFARVFLKDPGLVILDEASSRLDPATEALVERAVTKLLRGRTAIIIAHRLATLQRADVIMILEHGRIREHGSREQLSGDPGTRFSQLMRMGLEETLA